MRGGIRVKSNKEKTRYGKIEQLPFPEEVVLYTSQHIGAPSVPVVKKGDEVEKGQLIAEAAGGCSANLHASIGGMVKSVEVADKPGGTVSESIVITKGDTQKLRLMEPLNDLAPENVRERVKEAGIVGMGGAGFPSHVKLDPPKKIDTAFLNGCECEPFLTADELLMTEEADKVVKGFLICMRTVGADRGIIGIEDDKPDAIRAVKAASAGEKDIEVMVLPKIYPQGYEKMLIKETTGREVPSGGLPHDVGVSVHNVGTCHAVYEAVYEGKPLIERVLTLSGPEVIDGVNLRVPIGMKISEIIHYYQLETRPQYEIYMGGPMMGFALDSADMSVLKTTSGLLFSVPGINREEPCMRCGKCVDACPMGLVPQRLNMFYDGKGWPSMLESGLRDCMECGCCTYVCPSAIPLTYKFKTAKGKI